MMWHRNVLGVLLAIAGVVGTFAIGRWSARSTGVGVPDGRTGARTSADRQLATYRDFESYLLTADPAKRKKVQEAAGPAEIVPSRIFRAFDEICTKGNRYDDPSFKQDARSELSRNPAMTIMALAPIVREERDDGDPFAEDRTSIYLCLCYEIAAVETNGCAKDALAELSKSSRIRVARKCRSMLEDLKNDNYIAMSTAYTTNGERKALYWIDEHCLRKGMQRTEVEALLGPGQATGQSAAAYKARDWAAGNYLIVHYWDNVLQSREWKDGERN
jgi:hypothetical protein